MSEGRIHFKELSADQVESIYDQFRENFADKHEYEEFMRVQEVYHPHGIEYEEFVNKIANFSLYNTMNALRNKLGTDAIKEHTTDDGMIFYSLGNVPDIEGLR